jgi:TonB family protein
MLLWVALGVVIFVVPLAARHTAQPASDIAAPCAAESPGQAAPAIGIARSTQPRVRKEVIGNSPSSFDDMKVDGRVVVSATVNTDGKLCDIRVVAASPTGVGLEQTAIESAKGWRFAPATRDGVALRAPVTIDFTVSTRKEGRRPGQYGRNASADVKGADPLVAEPRPRSEPPRPSFPPH